MITLTAHGSFADSFLRQHRAEVTSSRDLPEADFIKKLQAAKVVIHNAATIHCESLDQSLERNFDFTRYVVRQLEEVNPNVHLILLSSMSILDPQNDRAYGDVLEMTPYAYSKYLAETFCLKSELRHVSSVRFSTLFYADPAKDGISKLVSDAVTNKEITIFNNGEARRNILPIDIAAQYVRKIASFPSPSKRTYTIAAPQSTSFQDIASLLKKLAPELVVTNKEVPQTAAVLSEFNTDSIDSLGRIEFSIDREITDYYRKLTA